MEEKPESPSGHKAAQQHGNLRRFSSMPMLRKLSRKKSGKSEGTLSYTGECEPCTAQGDTTTREPGDYHFSVEYLCSTVINPPLRSKHLRECVKQFQKQQAKAHKRYGVTPSSSNVTLTVEADGIRMVDPQRQDKSGHMFFPFTTVNSIKSHPENPEYFAFSTAVSGDTKHKCHLFLQDGVESADVIRTFEFFM